MILTMSMLLLRLPSAKSFICLISNFVALACQPWRRQPAHEIRLMADLADGDPVGRRSGRGGRVPGRPGLAGEVGRRRAHLLLGEGLGHGRHDRVVAVAGAVVVQLLDQEVLLLAPDDRNGLRIAGHAVLAVTRAADLHLGLDVVGGSCWPGQRGGSNVNAENSRNAVVEHGHTSCSGSASPRERLRTAPRHAAIGPAAQAPCPPAIWPAAW